RRHAHHALREKRSTPNGRTARHDADALRLLDRLRRVEMLVEKPERRLAAQRHVGDVPHAEAEQDALLDPGHGAPRSRLVALGRAHFAALQRAQERGDRALHVVHRHVGGRRVHERADPLADGRQIEERHRVAHANAPAVTNAARTSADSSWRSGTNGRRTTLPARPSIASAALTGMGFDSMNAARIHGDNCSWIVRAPAKSPARQHSTNRAILAGVTLDTTEMMPSPPAAITARVS